MPTDNLDRRYFIRSQPVDVRPISATAREQVEENIARARRSNGLDFESMFATVISEYMTQNNVGLPMAIIKLGFTEASTVDSICRWFNAYTGEQS